VINELPRHTPCAQSAMERNGLRHDSMRAQKLFVRGVGYETGPKRKTFRPLPGNFKLKTRRSLTSEMRSLGVPEFSEKFQREVPARSFSEKFQREVSARSFSEKFPREVSARSFSEKFQREVSARSFCEKFQREVSVRSFSEKFLREVVTRRARGALSGHLLQKLSGN